jgi:serine/threonine-protein kinase
MGEEKSNLVAGTRLGRYEIRSKLGEGGMGEVYLAQDKELDRKVALKILPADLATNEDAALCARGESRGRAQSSEHRAHL